MRASRILSVAYLSLFCTLGTGIAVTFLVMAAGGRLQTNGLGKALVSAFAVTSIVSAISFTAYKLKELRAENPGSFVGSALSPRPSSDTSLGLWWCARISAAAWLVMVGLVLVLLLCAKLNLLGLS
jgi:hypothetical protein